MDLIFGIGILFRIVIQEFFVRISNRLSFRSVVTNFVLHSAERRNRLSARVRKQSGSLFRLVSEKKVQAAEVQVAAEDMADGFDDAHSQNICVTALPPKADVCGALAYVCLCQKRTSPLFDNLVDSLQQ